MKTRRHHNNRGDRQVRTGKTRDQVRAIAKRVGVPEATALEKLVADLSDGMKWNWTRMSSDRDAADAVLSLMVDLGIIEHKEHRFGGNIWIVNGRRFGRIDD